MTPGGRFTKDDAVFVGRRAEVELVSRAVADARAGSPRVVVIEGEPGIGKTALVRHCLAAAGELLVLDASCDESEVTLDFGIVSQLVDKSPPDARPHSLGDLLGSSSPPSPLAVGAELLALLGSLQDSGPVVLVIDDAHWIDAASAGALLFALRRLYADRVCALVATRPDEPARAGSSWSRFTHDSERVQRLGLSGLDSREVGALAGSLCAVPVTHAAADRLREHTGGHPLYVRALIRQLPPDVLQLDHGPLPAPHSFAATVLARLSAASAETQDLVAAAAVAGPRCDVALAGAAAGVTDPIATLDEALAVELLTLTPVRVPTEIAFPHPLVRAAVYDDMSLTRRRELHIRCARLTSGAASLAHRVAASPGADDELAGELAATGEEEVADGKLAAGIDHLLLGSRIAGSRAVREAALLAAVDYLGIVGDVPRALSLREAVAACGDSARRSFALAVLTASAGHLPESIAALEEVTERRDFVADRALRGQVTSSLAIICAYDGRGSEAVAWARRTLSEEDVSATVELTAAQALALGLAMGGRAGAGVAALEPLPGARVSVPSLEAESLATRGNLKLRAGDLAGALEDLHKVIRLARAGAVPRSLANAYCSLALAEYRRGRWDEGPAHAELAISLADGNGQVWELPFAHAVAALFDAARGEEARARGHVDAARRAAEAAPLPLSIHCAAIAAAGVAAARGAWDEVLSNLERLPGGCFDLESLCAELRAEALLHTGRLDEAARILEPPDAGADAPAAGDVRIEWCRLRALLALARGDTAGALELFGDGLAAARSADAPLAQARLELAYGHFLRTNGRRSAATATLRRARAVAERLRTRILLEQCEAELAACGVRPASGDGDRDGYGLSAREQMVAELVASGKSNREVAGELYLSTKAIEYHLANIFAKVGVRSRHQLASRLTAARPAAPTG